MHRDEGGWAQGQEDEPEGDGGDGGWRMEEVMEDEPAAEVTAERPGADGGDTGAARDLATGTVRP